MSTQDKFKQNILINKILQEKIYKSNLVINQLVKKNKEVETELNNFTNSSSWKLTKPFRKLFSLLRLIKSKNKKLNTIKNNIILNNITKDNSNLEIINLWKISYKKLPLISIIIPTYNTNPIWLEEVINSVINQSYENWQLCIADDASTNPNVVEILKKYAQQDTRINITIRNKNGHISAASNSALGLAKGEWIGLLDHDDLLTHDALFWVANCILTNPKVKLIYSDEAKINDNNEIIDPYFKSDWNPDLFYCHNMICHFGVYKTEIINEIFGFRIGYEGAQDFDLALRFIEKINYKDIIHIPKILYYWRIHLNSTSQSTNAKPYAESAGINALNDHFLRNNLNAISEQGKFGYKVKYFLKNIEPSVSIIARTNESFEDTLVFINNIIDSTNYKNYEILIYTNVKNTILENYCNLNYNSVKIIKVDLKLSSPEAFKSIILENKSEVLVLIETTVLPKQDDWLPQLVVNAIRPDIGIVGPRVLYLDDTVCDSGLVLSLKDGFGCIYENNDINFPGHMSKAQLAQNISAISNNCFAFQRNKLLTLPVIDDFLQFNNLQCINICLNLLENDIRNLWLPYVDIYLTEKTETKFYKNEMYNSHLLYLKEKWLRYFTADPYYNINF